MKRQIGVLCLAAVLAVLITNPVRTEEILDSAPLEKTSLEAAKLQVAQKQINRQNEEKFPLTEKLDADKWLLVNLKPYCNINLFSREGRTCPVQFHAMETGKQAFYGVPFHIIAPEDNDNKTGIALPSQRLLTRELPASVTVEVGGKAAVVYFLHATYYTSKEGEQYYVIDYEDGTESKIRFVGTVHSGDWYHESTRIYTEDVHYALVPASKGSKLRHRNMHIFQWKNPSPEKKIKSITFKSDPGAEMAIMVVAVTCHPGPVGE